jgi:segregation and condensation protein B
VVGRPILYKTTRNFLIYFGLKSLDELPSVEEFEELIKTEHTAQQAELPLGDPEDGELDELDEEEEEDGEEAEEPEEAAEVKEEAAAEEAEEEAIGD